MDHFGFSLTRREVLKGIGAAAVMAASPRSASATEYKQADASWLAACRFGISTHWTARSKPVEADSWLPFEEQVACFNAEHYVDQVASGGAEYLIFTSTHALQMLAAPCAAIDRVMPGRTTKADLIGEIADACRARGLHFILYYNHSCNWGNDPEWEYSVGYRAPDKSRLTKNLLAIIRELGARYGSHVDGWWFDSCWSLDPRGTFNAVSTDLHGFKFPWDEFADAAKTGNPNRLVTLSSGMLTHFIYSTHQDYEWGEANDLVGVPAAQFTTDHLQGHRWVCIDNPDWVHDKLKTPLAPPRYELGSIVDYISMCNLVKVPVTFNVDIDRTGMISPKSLALLRDVKTHLT